MFELAQLQALLTVILIDVVLAGDNAVVVGLAAAGLPSHDQRRVIFWGIVIAFLMRVAFSVVALELLQIIGLVLAGGLLLLWVAWKMYRELKGKPGEEGPHVRQAKTVRGAIVQVALADVSMSLDNVLAVAGAARDHFWTLVFGLAFSLALMGLAANWLAGVMDRHRWIAYVGLLVVLYVALSMIWEGGWDVYEAVEGPPATEAAPAG
ncbi:MAG: TerC family protein [Geminicoccaceae bacterium]|nr:TerC family protein [Geminicoccaceae bacterium]